MRLAHTSCRMATAGHVRCRGMAQGAQPAAGQRSLAAFQSVVSMLTSPSCRRGAILSHFGEQLVPAAPGGRCCDVCDNPRLAKLNSESLLDVQAQAKSRGFRSLDPWRTGSRGISPGALEAGDDFGEEFDPGYYSGVDEGLEDGEDRNPGVRCVQQEEHMGGAHAGPCCVTQRRSIPAGCAGCLCNV